jgi:hypothetical protein
MLRYICNWHQPQETRCTGRVTQIIIYGCLNFHIDETLLCYAHTLDWLAQYKSGGGYICMECSRSLEDYQLVPIHKIKDTPQFRQKHILRRQ